MPNDNASADSGLAMLMFRDEYADRSFDQKQVFDRFVAWLDELDRRGKLVAVNPLARGGKTVRRRGAALVVDGPYAEGREAVLGYVIVRVKDLDEACALAVECAHSEAGGATEVRMVSDFPSARSLRA
jgi:hypothetical protein